MITETDNLQLAVKDDLNVAWEQVIKECNQIAGWKEEQKRTLTVSDVLNNVQPHKKIPETVTSTARKVVKTTLLCVQRFGDVVATATSAVFPPSQQCFNAVNFLILATQSTEEFFADVTTLMERVSVFLECLSVYLDDERIKAGSDAGTEVLDSRLRPSIYRVLEHFVVIITLSHALATRPKRERLKVFAKNLFFGDDSRIKDALATLETRVSDITRVQITVIGQDLKGAVRDVRELKADMDLMISSEQSNTSLLVGLTEIEESRRLMDMEKEFDETLRLKLGLDSRQSWRDRHTNISEEIVAGTGSWLLEHLPEFEEWADVNKNTVANVFSVSAPKGYGKTFLTYAVVEHLLGRCKKEDPERDVDLAYFYLPRTSQEPGATKQEGSSLNKALKALIYQFSQSNAAYREFIRSTMQEDIGLGNTAGLWAKLVHGFITSSQANFFVVIDGIEVMGKQEEELFSAIMRQISTPGADTSSTRLRVFFTGLPDAITDLQQRCGLKAPQISFGESATESDDLVNRDDVRKFLHARLKGMENFWDDSSVHQKHKTRIQQILLQHVGGNYERHNLVLREVEACRNVRQLDNILNHVNESQLQKIERQIEILNQNLSNDEIVELSAIIAWLHDKRKMDGSNCDLEQYFFWEQEMYYFAPRLPGQSSGGGTSDNARLIPLPTRNNSHSLNLVEEYLAITLENETESERLISLRKQIQEKYSAVLTVDDESLVFLKYDELNSFRSKTSESIAEQMAQRQQVAVLPEELALIQKIIKTQFTNVFGKDGDDLYKKYGLDEFFGSKTEGQKPRIVFNPSGNHAAILNACIIAINGQWGAKEFPTLRKYAYQNLKYHLLNADLHQTDSSTALRIGRGLVKLLQDDKLSDLWWNRPFAGESCLSPEFGNAMRTWLCQPAVLQKYEEVLHVTKWLNRVAAADNPAKVILEYVAKAAAKQYYSGELGNWMFPFRFLASYVGALDVPPSSKVATHMYRNPGTNVLLHAGKVEYWIETTCNLDADDLILLKVRTGQILFELSNEWCSDASDDYDNVQEANAAFRSLAQEIYDEAAAKNPNTLRVVLLRAQLDMDIGRYDEALQYLNERMEGTKLSLFVPIRLFVIPVDDWRLGNALLSECYFQTKNYRLAVDSYLPVVSLGVDNYEYRRVESWFRSAFQRLASSDADPEVLRLVRCLDGHATTMGRGLRTILTRLSKQEYQTINSTTARLGKVFEIIKIYARAMHEASVDPRPYYWPEAVTSGVNALIWLAKDLPNSGITIYGSEHLSDASMWKGVPTSWLEILGSTDSSAEKFAKFKHKAAEEMELWRKDGVIKHHCL
ncbi:hypothetical protein BU24DRAFT_429231 [Aaosphaeria arxii CBS 175.79]|uniref:Uncharacterized protein n=1 Tax=Aaosphaeria arxii CBS 175.79 TaxID=1450172 RepID=A0A6A5X700_9PLEO|nr:uncharacterized protein BU24DRAFT_429231 [Aaosphaeria arxii CBS 175.79]KAF2008656.1 hypothetical protein BU24DRAFT_429231 [Aaosphaeria arxii CBS 175.79]